jgi:hypothetical protein
VETLSSELLSRARDLTPADAVAFLVGLLLYQLAALCLRPAGRGAWRAVKWAADPPGPSELFTALLRDVEAGGDKVGIDANGKLYAGNDGRSVPLLDLLPPGEYRRLREAKRAAEREDDRRRLERHKAEILAELTARPQPAAVSASNNTDPKWSAMPRCD